VVAFGLDQEAWIELGCALIDRSNELLGTSLDLRPLPLSSGRLGAPDASEAVKLLKSRVFEGYPVLCGFGGALDHYTVLVGYSERRLTLFDSSGLHWLDQRSIGASEYCGKRHWLYVESARVVVDTW
jgi:hypothetical protein